MGTVCTKTEPAPSPRLPVCELIRRCAVMMCPVGEAQQKTASRTRKLTGSEIIGPMSKKDSWCQTDPLPPPRHRRGRKRCERRRSRSAESLPRLLRDPSAMGALPRGSLDELSLGHEDLLDFQMYLGRLPGNSPEPREEGKDSITDKKKEFLSGLLGEENNNFVLQDITNVEPRKSSQTSGIFHEIPPEEVSNGLKIVDSEKQKSSNVNQDAEGGSRRSSITESLREFECSLLDSLDEEEASLTVPQNLGKIGTLEEERDEEEEIVKMMVPFRKKELPTLPEEELTEEFDEEVEGKGDRKPVSVDVENTPSRQASEKSKILNYETKDNIEVSDATKKDLPKLMEHETTKVLERKDLSNDDEDATKTSEIKVPFRVLSIQNNQVETNYLKRNVEEEGEVKLIIPVKMKDLKSLRIHEKTEEIGKKYVEDKDVQFISAFKAQENQLFEEIIEHTTMSTIEEEEESIFKYEMKTSFIEETQENAIPENVGTSAIKTATSKSSNEEALSANGSEVGSSVKLKENSKRKTILHDSPPIITVEIVS